MTNDVSRGFMRRWVIVDFPHTFSDTQEPELPETLRSEVDGIFVLAVRALQRLAESGDLAVSERSRDRVEEYRVDSDPVEQFLQERLTVNPEGEVAGEDLYSAYALFAERNGHKPRSNTSFGRHLMTLLKDRGVEKKHTMRGKVWVGISLSPRRMTG